MFDLHMSVATYLSFSIFFPHERKVNKRRRVEGVRQKQLKGLSEGRVEGVAVIET